MPFVAILSGPIRRTSIREIRPARRRLGEGGGWWTESLGVTPSTFVFTHTNYLTQGFTAGEDLEAEEGGFDTVEDG